VADDRAAELLALREALLERADERLQARFGVLRRLEAGLDAAARQLERGVREQVLERGEVEVDGAPRHVRALGDLADGRLPAVRDQLDRRVDDRPARAPALALASGARGLFGRLA
jgi:hypothetical protein